MKSCCIAIGVASLCAFASSPASAQIVDGPKVEWRFSTWGKPRAFTTSIEKVAELVRERSGGKFTIKISYGEALSQEKENLDGIQIGAFEMADMCNYYHPGKTPAYMVMSLPFIPLSDPRVSKDVREAMMRHPAFIADLNRWNAQAYMSGLLPPFEFLGKGAPPKTLEGWKNLRVRAGGGIGDAMVKLGAVLSTTLPSEAYTAIERGTVDAVSFPYFAHVSYQINTVASWFTSNLSPATAECNSVISKDAYNKLPPQYQKLLEEAKEPAYAVLMKAYAESDEKIIQLLRAKLTEIVYSDAELAKFRESAGKPVWDKWIADNKGKFDSQNVFDTLMSEIKKAESRYLKTN
jgi:TRAP-type C4-dicarboxylate transport system substrate-binding protein